MAPVRRTLARSASDASSGGGHGRALLKKMKKRASASSSGSKVLCRSQDDDKKKQIVPMPGDGSSGERSAVAPVWTFFTCKSMFLQFVIGQAHPGFATPLAPFPEPVRHKVQPKPQSLGSLSLPPHHKFRATCCQPLAFHDVNIGRGFRASRVRLAH
jgi:hypothetical protein